MAIGTVKSVTHNVTKTFKSGKSATGSELSFITDGGSAKKEFIVNFVDYFSVVSGLTVGDKIEANYIKNGEFFNLKGVKLIEKGDGVAPVAVAPTGGGSSFSSGGYRQEDPEKQAMIVRQSSIKTAADIIATYTAAGLYKKATKEEIINDLFAVTNDIESYAMGKVKAKDMVMGSIGAVEDPSFGAVEDNDIPF